MRLGPGWKFIAAGIALGLCFFQTPTTHAECQFQRVQHLLEFSKSPYISNTKPTPSMVSYLIRYHEAPDDPDAQIHHYTLNLADPAFQELVELARKKIDRRPPEDFSDLDIYAIANLVTEHLKVLDPDDPLKASPSSRLLSLQAMGGELDFFDRIPLTYASLTPSTVVNDVQRVLILAEVYMALGLTIRLRNMWPDVPAGTTPEYSHYPAIDSRDLFIEIYVEHRDLLKRLSMFPGLQWVKRWPGMQTLRRALAGVYWRLDPYSNTLIRAGFTPRGTRVVGGEPNDRLERAQLTSSHPQARAVPLKPLGFFGTEKPNFTYGRRVDHPEDAFLENTIRLHLQKIFAATQQAKEGHPQPLDTLLLQYLKQTPFDLYLKQEVHRRALALHLDRPLRIDPSDEVEFFSALVNWIELDVNHFFLPTSTTADIQKQVARWFDQRRHLSHVATQPPYIITSETTAFYGLSKAFYQARRQALHRAAFELLPAQAHIIVERLAHLITHPDEFGLTHDHILAPPRMLISAFVRMHSKTLAHEQVLVHVVSPDQLDRLAAQTQTKTTFVLLDKSDVDDWLADGIVHMERQDTRSSAPPHLSGHGVNLTFVSSFTQSDTTTQVYLYLPE